MVDLESAENIFDSNYRVVIQVDSSEPNIFSILDFLDSNSIGNIRITMIDREPLPPRYLVAFENEDDALFFRIKFG